MVATVATLGAAGCASPSDDAGSAGSARSADGTPPPPTGPGLPAHVPAQRLDPADFVSRIDNPWLPWRPGSRWVYTSTSSDGPQRITVTVTDRTRVVAGVPAVVVHDRVTTPSGRLLEDTYDWYAQDRSGNVWYLGEDTTAYEDGGTSTEGSWETGVDGAAAGIAMPAQPRVGQRYAQEWKAGEAEDQGEVVAVGVSVDVPAGSYTGTVRTEDTTPLEPHLVENKFYARGVGVVREATLAGGDEEVRLVRVSLP